MKPVSKLSRRVLVGCSVKAKKSSRARVGVPLLPSRGEVVTLKKVQNLMDREGLPVDAHAAGNLGLAQALVEKFDGLHAPPRQKKFQPRRG
jgi:hypothetical protein